MSLLEKILARRSLTVGLLLVLTAAGYWVPQVLGEDPGFGLSVWNDMLRTGSFNTFFIPLADNIGENHPLFLTWWSPGQYIVPGVISQVLNISLGMAGLWATLAFSMAGLIGWFYVYRQLAFDKTTIALCLFFIATSRLFTINFLNYTGGELLLFGSQSWTIWYFLKYRQRPLILFMGLLVLSLLSFFLKSAYTIGLAALCGCAGIAFLRDFFHQKKLFITAFWTALAVGLCMVCYLVITQLGFVNLGTSPITSTNQPFHLSWPSFETLTYPLTHWFSIAEIYPQLLLRTNFPIWGHSIYYALMGLGMLGLISVLIKTEHDEARWVFMGFYLIYCGIFLLLYNKGAEISVEYRHTKVVAYLFLPLLLVTLRGGQLSGRSVFVLLLILNTGYGLATFIFKKFEIKDESATGVSGFALRHASKEDLAFIHEVDQPGNILYFTSGSLNVDAVKARKLVGSIDFKFAKGCGFIEAKYDGKAGKIYAFVHEAYEQIPGNPSLGSQFPNYRFRLIKKTKKFKIYEGN